jgi:hypothetical protein
MPDPRLDGGPYFVPTELHHESDRFLERFHRCPLKRSFLLVPCLGKTNSFIRPRSCETVPPNCIKSERTSKR